MKKILPEFVFSDEQLNAVASLAAKTGLCEQTVKILYGRGIEDEEAIRTFLHPSRSHFVSPFKMKGMREAVGLITRARDEGWQVVVYGDYDADGICASTIMRGVLEEFGISPAVFVPERTSGYGLGREAVDAIFEEYFPQLFITVDCGISNAEIVEYIKEQGAEVIVTDHHELPPVLPDCICVNPKIEDDYPFDNLCGAGVAFKVGCALLGTAAYKFLDFAAIATVADSVPLTGENRDIVAEGLKLINSSTAAPYSSFLGKPEEPVTAQTIAFSIAPKINAAGRMGDANAALRLFCSHDPKTIFDLSAKLAAYNIERQRCCDELYASAKAKLREEGAEGRIIMLHDESWNTGFVGIVAARLAEEYARPALLFVKNGDTLKGSARSVEAINIYEALRACSHLISEFGGHSQAAGVNVDESNFASLKAALNAYLEERYPADAFTPTLYVSGELTSPVSPKFAHELELLEPFGVGFKRPLFVLGAGRCRPRPVKPASPHLAIKSDYIDLMYFNGAHNMALLSSGVPKKLVFEYNLSTFRGREYVKGFVRDVVYSGSGLSEAEEEIASNNLAVAALPPVNCLRREITSAECERLISSRGPYGTVFVASDIRTLAKIAGAKELEVNLFDLSNKNVASCIVLSPSKDCDLSGYSRVVFLDGTDRITLPSLEGKEVLTCKDYDGWAFFSRLSAVREELLSVFKIMSANAANLEGADAAEVAFKNNFGCPPLQAQFALEVFAQLGLISFSGGSIAVNRGIKTDLSNSPLYNAVRSRARA